MRKAIEQPTIDFGQVDLGDKRLNERLKQFVEAITKNAKKSIMGSARGRNEAKAFYRMLKNEKLDINQLLGLASGAALSRMSGTVLLIQDTSDINLNGHKKTEGLGYCSEHVKGIKLHSYIAVSPEGIPYGLISQSYETRPESKSKLTNKEKSARPISEKESYRWIETLRDSTAVIPKDVHFITVCDREGDIYELYAEAGTLEADFIIRVAQDRCSDTDEKTITKIRQTKALGRVAVNIPRDYRKGTPARKTEMEVASCLVNIIKPVTVRDREVAPTLAIKLIRITELDPPNGNEPIEWILTTSLPVETATEIITVVEYYIQRWKIERFHFVLKSGLGAEKIQQRTVERINTVLLIYSVVALFIMAVTYMGRVLPDIRCDILLDTDEWQMLYRIIHKTKIPPEKPYSLADAILYLGELGSYKRAPSDGLPGLKSIWNGLFKLYEFMDLFVGQV